LKLEGRLVGDWVALLATELASDEDARPRVVLDCAGVAFANQTGVSLLRAASARGVVLTGCSPLLCSLIESVAP
jgi:anti-anti-sigma regulatory factor